MKCKLCGKNEATCFDREKPWLKRESVCIDCHSNRLKHDFVTVLEVEKKRKERIAKQS